MAVQRVGPSRARYWISAALVAGAVGCVVLAVFEFLGLVRQPEEVQRFAAPGRHAMTFEAGAYTLFDGHEGRPLVSFTIDEPGRYFLAVEDPFDPQVTGWRSGEGAAAFQG